jgi:hypothetical protein
MISALLRQASTAARRRRMALFLRLLYARFDEPVHILDCGGMPSFWTPYLREYGVAHVTTVNLDVGPNPDTKITATCGDACTMPQFGDGQFDVCFSNSLIEHVGDWSRQQAAAGEMRRVACYYFVQTPAKSFPLEPHFLIPFLPLYPPAVQAWLVSHWPIRRRRCAPAAKRLADWRNIRLLTATEMRHLFPNCALVIERWGGMAKSYMAHNLIDCRQSSRPGPP